MITGKILLDRKVKESTIVYKASSEDVNIYDSNIDSTAVAENSEANTNISSTESLNNVIGNVKENKGKTEVADDGTIDINFLGEIMMGGNVTTNLKYNYVSAFKDIYSLTRLSDFTYANFSTNITNLDKIEDAKSKYLVTKEIVSGLNALGLDAVSIASDHMTDFTKDIFKSTTNILEENNIFVAGRENMPVYLEKGNKKIAIISTNSVIIGTSRNYTNYGISIYSRENIKKNISEAKQVADVVIVDVHWGREYTYGVTDQMRNIATASIDDGADMVIGTHALGVYPVVKYKDKPIIYSTGYLIGDSDYNVAKESFIFNVDISKYAKIDCITMTPIYIDNMSKVKLYKDYDNDKATLYLNQFNSWQIDNSLDSRIDDSKIIVNF
jgi:poly-gamma-glutamate synthesis protein (capsule biosynthesis protein)